MQRPQTPAIEKQEQHVPATGRRLNEHEAADFLGLKVKTLRDWRMRRKGPDWLKLCGAVRYDTRTLEAFLAASQQTVAA